MRKDKNRRERTPSLGLSVLSLLLIAALWILFVGGTRRDEMIAGAGVLFSPERSYTWSGGRKHCVSQFDGRTSFKAGAFRGMS